MTKTRKKRQLLVYENEDVDILSSFESRGEIRDYLDRRNFLPPTIYRVVVVDSTRLDIRRRSIDFPFAILFLSSTALSWK